MPNIPEVAIVLTLAIMGGYILFRLVLSFLPDRSSTLAHIDSDFIRSMDESDFSKRYNRGP